MNRISLSVAAAGLAIALSALPALAQNQNQTGPLTTAPTGMAPLPNVGGRGPWLESWTGFGFTNNYYGGYFGAVRALNETQNLFIDGWVFRAAGMVGHYDYNGSSLPTTLPRVDVDFNGGDAMFGYRKIVGQGLLTGYIGVNYENHANPDPIAKIKDMRAGLKLMGEYYTPVTQTAYFYTQATYSTAFQTWFAYAQLPFQIADKIWFGPEGTVFGNEAPFREARAGGVLRAQLTETHSIQFSGGYRQPLTSGPDGYYVNIHYGIDWN